MDVEPEWLASAGDPALPCGGVHVWRADLDLPLAQMQAAWEVLSGDERARAERIVVEQARDRFVAGRALLRAVLGGYLRLDPGRVALSYSAQGKPHLAPGSDASGLAFNLAHSRGLALLAVTVGRPVGVDLEWLRPVPDADGIAGRFFSAQEREALRALPAHQRLAGFFACWTRKEAWLKATQDGLRGALDAFSVSVAPGEPARLLHVAGDKQATSRWSLLSFVPAPGAVGALAVEGRGWDVAWWDLRLPVAKLPPGAEFRSECGAKAP